MVEANMHLINSMLETVVHEVQPYRVYLFGSHVEGRVTPDSDVDLLIVEDKEFPTGNNRWDELKRIRHTLRSYRVPKDILVYSRSEFDKWRNIPNHIVYHVFNQGTLLYERH